MVGVALSVALLQKQQRCACWMHGFTLSDAAPLVKFKQTDQARHFAMNKLGLGLHDAQHHEDALVVQEAELSMLRRLGESDEYMLVARGNIDASSSSSTPLKAIFACIF